MRIAATLLLLVCRSSPRRRTAEPSSGPTAISLADLERMALENNPTLRPRKRRSTRLGAAPVRRARGRIPLPDTRAKRSQRATSIAAASMGSSCEQTIVLGGKLRLGRAVFDRAAERAEQERDLQRQRILSSVRRAFFAVLALERRVDVHERLAALASEAVGVTAQLFNVGAADRPDFLESEIEARRVQLELNAARESRLRPSPAAGRRRGRRGGGRTNPVGFHRFGLTGARARRGRSGADRAEPAMRAARAELARTQAVTALARRETFPDLFVRGGAAHNRERGEDTGRGPLDGRARSKPASRSRCSIAMPVASRPHERTKPAHRPRFSASNCRCVPASQTSLRPT